MFKIYDIFVDLYILSVFFNKNLIKLLNICLCKHVYMYKGTFDVYFAFLYLYNDYLWPRYAFIYTALQLVSHGVRKHRLHIDIYLYVCV